MNKKLIIFPTKKQLKYLESKSSIDDFYVLVRDNDVVEQENIRCIIDSDKNILENDMDVLCCHEEGMYWLRIHGRSKWNNIFAPDMVNLVNKKSFKDYLIKNDIRTANYCENTEHIQGYPIVVKPIIGFGSIGVKRIENKEDLKSYLAKKTLEDMYARIKPYKDRYFEDIENSVIFEEFISGDFYRTPFVVYDNEIKYVFPVKGIKTTYRKNSDYHWTDFEYGDNERKMVPYLNDSLQRLLTLFELQNGVYVAEFIISEEKEAYLLEFSPRQTSERIARIIQLASGIDLEKLAIDLFLGYNLPEISLHRTIRMQILRSQDVSLETNYLFIEKKEEGSVYGDKIMIMYTEKVPVYE